MKQFYLINRMMRRKLRSILGDNIFFSHPFQVMLGFKKCDFKIVDRLQTLLLEYDYQSDIGQALFWGGFFEENEINFFSRQLKTDNKPIILDIGANIGLHSIKWAGAMPNCKIYAFEPASETRAMLERNINRNNLQKNIDVLPYAVSDQKGCTVFYNCNDNAYSSLKDTKRKDVVSTEEVLVTTIDDLVEENNITKISLIKIDVEGFETEVILGAQKTLHNLKPKLFVEIYGGDNSNSEPERTVELICSMGYKAFILKSGIAVPYQKHSDLYYNYFFTHVI